MIYRETEEERRPVRPRRRTGWIVALVIVLALAGGVLFAVNYVKSEVSGAAGNDSPVVIDIPEGATADTVTELLRQNGVIRSEFIFRNYLRFFYTGDADFMYGPHEVTSGMDFDTVIEALKTPMADQRETIWFTFPEGWTALKMGMYLEEQGFCSVDEWVEACNTGSYDVTFFGEISDSEDKFIKLEGFLFPDTYEFFADATPRDVVQRMLETFEEKVLADPAVKQQIESSGYTLEEVITLASVVQKESGDINEIYKVSSVFHNRLAPDSSLPSLQSCATREYVWYVLDYYYGDLRGEATPENMAYRYNTYESSGLMAGPISNPGVEAIDATLNPEDTPYYYFLMDNTGKTYYGVTYADHQRHISEMEAVNAELKYGIG